MAKPNVLEKFLDVILKPKRLFESVRKEKELKDSLLFFSIVTIISNSLNYAVNPAAYSPIAAALGIGGPALVAILIVTGIATSFLFFGYFHLFVMLLGGKQGYSSTYRAFAYASAPTILSWIPLVGIVFSLWALALEIYGVSLLHKISIWRALGAIALGIGIIVVAAVIFALLLYGTTAALTTPAGP